MTKSSGITNARRWSALFLACAGTILGASLSVAEGVLPPPMSGRSMASAEAQSPEAPDSTTPPPIEIALQDSVAPGVAPTDSAPSTVRMNPPLSSGTRKVRLDKMSDNVVRSGPGDRFAIAGVYAKGTTFPVIAKSGDWYNVRLSETEAGWIHASLCKEFDDLSDLEFRPNPKLYSRTGSYILTGYSGAYAFDRKSNSLVLGGRLGYYVFDRLQVEGGVGWTHVKRPAEIVESLFDLKLEAENFHMLFYHLMATWELLPGRQMVPYITGGMGSAIMQGDTETSFDFGAGTMLFLSKRTAMRWEVRDYRFKSGSEGARRSNNNIEFTLGTAILF